jgi:putative Holliday junction resolvase
MRILGIDYGSKRLGLSVCDELGITAQGLTTVVRKDMGRDLDKIAHYIDEYGIEKIVVGYPVRLDGTQGIQCEKVDRFAERLESRFGLPVIKWDESLSTKEAERILIEADMSRKKRKKVVDKIAAYIILQGYLEYVSRTEKR